MNVPIDWLEVGKIAAIGAAALVALGAALLVVLIPFKAARMKLRREWGYFKARFKYRPKKPSKEYTVE